VHAREPLGRERGEAGWAEDSAQKPNLNKKSFFFFQNCFINYKSILIQIKFKFQQLLLAQ
jgi:hypothetical protein